MIVSMLRSRGMKVTPQRVAILECLHEKTHPTIDEVYQKVLQKLPSVSLATVYKNLNALYDEGAVKQVNTGKVIRYDIMGSAHIHSVCKKCHRVTDIFLGEKESESIFDRIGVSTGQKVEGCDITVFGVCPSCEEHT